MVFSKMMDKTLREDRVIIENSYPEYQRGFMNAPYDRQVGTTRPSWRVGRTRRVPGACLTAAPIHGSYSRSTSPVPRTRLAAVPPPLPPPSPTAFRNAGSPGLVSVDR